MLCQRLHRPGQSIGSALYTPVVGAVRRSKEYQKASRVALFLGVKAASSPAGVLFVAEQETPQQETFDLLEWPEVCKQVVAFTQTTLAAEKLFGDYLPVGQSQADSERLLQETAEARQAQLNLEGVQDLRPLLDGACQGRRLSTMHLAAVAKTLQQAQILRQALQMEKPSNLPGGRADRQESGQGHMPTPAGSQVHALQQLAVGLGSGLPDLTAAICHCINVTTSALLDRASPRLAEARLKRRENKRRLQEEMDSWAQNLHQQGACESRQVVIRRERLCVGVKAGRQGELPKGSLTLDRSSTGATLYMEPEPAVGLNNAEARLAGQESDEQDAILSRLSVLVADDADTLDQILDAIAELDIANARGRHAEWLQATQPRFLSEAECSAGQGCMTVSQARHPLLLRPCLAPLPVAPTTADTEPSVGIGQPIDSSRPPKPATFQNRAPPVPLDLLIPSGKTVVVVTGPNTGGKTATLKALGLMALMAKAGLFLPVLKRSTQRADSSQNTDAASPSQTDHSGQPRLLWFDKVLADVGDGQNLQQSLSTFSGHVRRLCGVLAACTPKSLVLLDEVGSGTDPAEGAALAGAILDRLAGSARLTFATSHHAELKDVPDRDKRYMNAAVEFDIKSLRPTYRLQWGLAGASNALAVATGLGFDARVVAAAREISAQATAERDAEEEHQHLQGSMENEVKAVQAAADAATQSLAQAKAALTVQQQDFKRTSQSSALLKDGDASVAQGTEAVKRRLDQVLNQLQAGSCSDEDVVRRMESFKARWPSVSQAQAELTNSRRKPKAFHKRRDQAAGSPSATRAPHIGDTVRLLRIGDSMGKVQSINQDGSLLVQAGKLKVRVQQHEVEHAVPEPTRKRPQSSAALPLQNSQESQSEGGEALQGLTIQSPYNSVDVRGKRSEAAFDAIDELVMSDRPLTTIFVIHGVGTGRLRAAIHKWLPTQKFCKSFQAEDSSAGGCTLVKLRQ
ncbi:hypothetical protein WJX74_004733 [Apatococcus lobatus]|uniref:Smr domain-containing protein n=1 Tax=Apatococcus lobatus TaxID=904363 RepID=A0AAW1RGW7_9CHLO